jgi:hypothetical protein
LYANAAASRFPFSMSSENSRGRGRSTVTRRKMKAERREPVHWLQRATREGPRKALPLLVMLKREKKRVSCRLGMSWE